MIPNSKDQLEDQSDSSQDQWAEKRTDWSEDRTILANERTFAAWVRTGLASLAVAIGFQAVFSEFQPTWAAKSTATFFVAAAILIFLAGGRRSVKAQNKIDSHVSAAQPTWRMIFLSSLLVIASIATGFVLWII